MASDKLQKILSMSKNIDKQSKKINQANPKQLHRPISIAEQVSKADRTISSIDAMFNSPYVPTKKEKETWNSERGRKALTDMADKTIFDQKLKASHLPSAILESIRQNPCNMDPTIVNNLMGPENEFFKKLNEVYGKEKEAPKRGIDAVQQINEQLKTRDTRTDTILENETKSEAKETIKDISNIEEIIERVLDKKIVSLIKLLQHNSSSPTIRSMSLNEGGSFKFLDTEDNVYECKLTFLGKRKKKQK